MPKRKREYHNPINGEYTKILETSEETSGEYTHFEVRLTPGGKNPLHYHTRFTEEFVAVDGILGLQQGKRKVYLQPGESLLVKEYTHHLFFNDTADDIIFRVKLRKGQPGFENFLKAMFGLVNDGQTITRNQIPKKLLTLAVMAQWGDTHLVNPLVRFSAPVLRQLYKIAVKRGREKELLDKYCH